MHLADGILSLPVLAAGTSLALAGVGLGLRRMAYEQIPQVAVLSASFFVASLIHVPVGPGQAHLILNGLAGLVLGWAVFPALLAALLLQAIFFGYGGVTVLGINTLNMALPGVACWYLLRPLLRRAENRAAVFTIGFSVGGLAITMSAALIGATLYLTNNAYFQVALAIVIAHLPIMVVEGLLSGVILVFLKKTAPQILPDTFRTTPPPTE